MPFAATAGGALLYGLACAVAHAQTHLPVATLKLPPGFTIEVVARVPNARAMTWGAAGTLFVGSASEGKVYALTLPPPGTKGEAVASVIASGLREPAGVAFRDGALYVSAVSRILRFDDIERRLANPPPPVVVSDRFPTDGHHGRKFIAFGPDGKLYVPVGMPCNVCEQDPDRYGVIMRMNPDGTGLEVFARGLRNTVGFDWDPRTKELWFTDNGRDMLGDDLPPDTLNHAPRAGLHFGFPYCHAGTLPDPEFGGCAPAARSGRPRRISGRTSRRSACASTPERSFLPRIATGSSSPSTARGTAAARSAIASRWSRSTATRRCATSPSPKAGCRGKAPGDVRRTCWSRRTARCSFRTTTPERSTASATAVSRVP